METTTTQVSNLKTTEFIIWFENNCASLNEVFNKYSCETYLTKIQAYRERKVINGFEYLELFLRLKNHCAINNINHKIFKNK